MTRALALAALVLAAAPAAAAPAKPDYGILLLAHGGDPDWNAQVEDLRRRVDAKVPAEAAIGMADPATIQPALDRLAARGVARVIAVPFFIQSRSEVMDQTRYVLGLRRRPSEVMRRAARRFDAMMASMPLAQRMMMPKMHLFGLERVKTRLPLAMTPALDGSPIVARVLLERARALSRDPGREIVVLVAHGPVDDRAVPAWDETLARQAAAVRRAGGFAGASYAILRDD
ncbi:MAG: hypothetical protein KGM24_04750, partial [Elusimicrobia bacterium]|nr:hypothetical protein [Elusimicrobiota bacterium]